MAWTKDEFPRIFCPCVFMLVMSLMTVINADWCPAVCTCYRRLTTTDCSGRHVSAIPLIPNVTTHLYMENNHIEHLKAHAFSTTPNLLVLTLHGNQLTLLDSSAFEGLHKLQELNLSRNQLILLKVTSTENVTLPALKELDMSGNYLNSVPHNLSRFSPSLQVLNLSDNGITSALIDPTYRFLKKLQRIDLTGNPIHTISSSHFNSLKHGPLEVLLLANCGIHLLNRTSFKGLDNLTSLSLAHNPINVTVLRNAFSGLGNETPLAFLDLSSNFFPIINADILQTFAKLQILDLSNCTIKEVSPNVFFFLLSLHTLELQDNKISKLENLASLIYLRRLDMRNNRISVISVSGLVNLEFVDLSHNWIQEIPAKWITKTHGLTILNLSHNRIKHISPHAFQDVTLNHLDLSYNYLTTLHSFGMFKLSMLILAHNRMHTITDDAFIHLEQTLEDIDLSSNAFSKLPDHHFGDFIAMQRFNIANNDLGNALKAGKNSHLFYSLRHLQVLDLSNSNVTIFPHCHTKHMHHLTTLDLHGNNIKHLSDISLYDMASLAKLDVSRNILHSVDTTLLSDLQYLEMIDLSSNPFHCTCDLVDLVLWINSTSVTVFGMEDHKQYQCIISATQGTRYIMTYHPRHKECINRHHNVRQDLTIFGIVVCVLVGATLITGMLIYYGKLCQRLKTLHYRWQIRYREISGVEVLTDSKL